MSLNQNLFMTITLNCSKLYMIGDTAVGEASFGLNGYHLHCFTYLLTGRFTVIPRAKLFLYQCHTEPLNRQPITQPLMVKHMTQ